MKGRINWRLPILTASRLILFAGLIVALYVFLDLSRRAESGKQVGVGAEALEKELASELERQIGLKATLSYVQSDEYVAVYAREEGGMLLDNEKRVVPLIVEGTPQPPIAIEPTPDPGLTAQSWQAWWQLITDASVPERTE